MGRSQTQLRAPPGLVPVLLVAMALLTHVSEARACDDLVAHDRILGVAPSGSFVIRRFVSGGISCSINSFEIRDRHGSTIGSYADGDGGASSQGTCPTNWTGQGAQPVPIVASEPPASLERRLKRAMSLTPLRPSPRRVVVRQNLATGDPCFRAYLAAPGGRVLVWEAREGHRGHCLPVSLRVAHHPRSPLLFLPYEQRMPTGCSIDEESVHWVALSVVQAATAARQAKRHLDRGRLAEAVAAARRSLASHPGYVPARVHLAKALARQGVPWPEARRKLPPWRSRTHSCVGGNHWEWLQLLFSDEFQNWRRSSGFEAWVGAQQAAHDRAHPGEDNPQAAWGPNRQ